MRGGALELKVHSPGKSEEHFTSVCFGTFSSFVALWPRKQHEVISNGTDQIERR